MSKSIDSQLNETLRDALVAYYLNEVVPNTAEFVDAGLADKIKTANDLYEFKLLDVQVSQDVPTSPVASAIASLQQYINGALMGMEPGYESKVMEDHLIIQWRDIFSQFSIWAANQLLQYYPEAYIDPSLRLSKSMYFQQLENDLNQNKIHIDTTQKAVLDYLASFEEVANLTIINGYINTDDFKNGMYYFVGKSRVEGAYYWRSVDMSQRTYKDLTGTNPNRPKFDYPQPGAWSDWHKAALPISASAIERTIRPVLFNNRLFVFWVEYVDSSPDAVSIEHNKPPEPGAPVTTVRANPMLRLNMVYKKYDDSWSMPQTVIQAWSEASEFKTQNVQTLVENIVVVDSSASPESMFVAMYAGYRAGNATDGVQDQYAFLKTAWIDKSFNVTPLFPSLGYVSGSSVGEVGAKKFNVLRVARAYARDNVGRFQFKMPALKIDIKSIHTVSYNPGTTFWDYLGWQTRIEVLTAYDVKYNSESASLEFSTRISAVFPAIDPRVVISLSNGGGIHSRVTLVFSEVPSVTGGYLTLLPGSQIEVVRDVFGGKSGQYVFYLVQQDSRHVSYVQDNSNSHYCSLPAQTGGAVTSLAGKVVRREAIFLLKHSPTDIREVKGFLPGESGGHVWSVSWVFANVEPYSYKSTVRRPTNLAQPAALNPGDSYLFMSGGLPVRIPPDSYKTIVPISSETLLPDWGGVGLSARKKSRSFMVCRHIRGH
ncbi:neuraminidase-like domain-containing protein [Pseudomonas sp. H1_D04]